MINLVHSSDEISIHSFTKSGYEQYKKIRSQLDHTSRFIRILFLGLCYLRMQHITKVPDNSILKSIQIKRNYNFLNQSF